MGYRRKKDDDAALGCVVRVIFVLILMPIAGLFLVGSKDPEKQKWGWVLLAAGTIFWLIIGISSI